MNLVGLCDMHPPTLAKAVASYPSVPAFSSVESLLSTATLDAVIIVVPAVHHFAVALQCIKAGKHVFIEKPLAVSVTECNDLVAAATAAGVRLFVDHTFLFNSSLHKLHEVMSTSEVGQPLYLHAKRTNLGPIRTDVSALWDLATHDISMILALVPTLTPSWASCTGAKLLAESPVHDVVFLTIGFKDSPLVAHVHASWMDPSKEREVVVVCTKARIIFDDTEMLHPIRILMKGPKESEEPQPGLSAHILAQKGDVIMPYYDRKEPLAAAVNEFVRWVRESASTCTSDGVFGTKVVAILQAADQSLAASGAPQPIAL
eukprot:c33428_g1_i1.p1 GENE.c33428_g1_i1~~c33428_g1_i1.p1  ORF type:complete len:357 (-),score=74.63 c33428_g1_i1:22-972(-)